MYILSTSSTEYLISILKTYSCLVWYMYVDSTDGRPTRVSCIETNLDSSSGLNRISADSGLSDIDTSQSHDDPENSPVPSIRIGDVTFIIFEFWFQSDCWNTYSVIYKTCWHGWPNIHNTIQYIRLPITNYILLSLLRLSSYCWPNWFGEAGELEEFQFSAVSKQILF